MGLGNENVMSTKTGESVGAGSCPCAMSAMSLFHPARFLLADVTTGCPFTMKVLMDPCGCGRPWTWRRTRASAAVMGSPRGDRYHESTAGIQDQGGKSIYSGRCDICLQESSRLPPEGGADARPDVLALQAILCVDSLRG